ncbi:HMP-PP phosphatase [Lysinibacillus sphaericus]
MKLLVKIVHCKFAVLIDLTISLLLHLGFFFIYSQGLELFSFRMPGNWVDISTNLLVNPTSLLIQANEVNSMIIRDHLQAVHAEVIEHRRWGAPLHIIEIVRRGLNKAVGISHVAKDLGIPRERIIAFGDEDNDLEMIDYAGIGVAMGNRIPSLKNIANEITTTNNEDGIAKILIERLKLS